MPRQSNKALEKFNNPTAESIQRKQAKELVDDEYNDIRRQIIRREFDQVGLYNEIFDANRQKFGDTLVEYKLMELFRKYLQEIAESRVRLGENRPNPFNDLIGAYNAFIASLSTYVDLAKKEKSVIDVKSYQDQLRESAIPLQELLNLALGMVSGAVPSVPVAAAPAVSAVEAPGLVAEREDRRRPAYEDEHRDNPFLADEAVQNSFNRALARRQQRQADESVQNAFNSALARRQQRLQEDPRVGQLEQNYQNALALARQSGMGKAHGGDMGDFLKRFAMNFAKNTRVGHGDGGSLFAPRPGPQAQPPRNQPPGPGRLHVYNRNTGSYVWRDMSARARGGYRAFGSRRPTTYTGGNTDMFWKFLLGAGKAFGGNKPTENDILDLFNLIKEVQRGFVPNQPFRGVSAMTDAEKKNQKAKLSAFEGADEEKKKSDISEVIRIYTERLPAMEAMDVNDLRSINRVIKILEKNKEGIMTAYSKFQYAKKGDYRPNELNELKDLTKSIDTQLGMLYERKKTLGGGKAHGGMKTDTNFGQLVAESEARNPRKKNCHYNTRGFLISCSGKAHGGQAGFSLDKTREIVDQWPGFPYYVPPSSKTGPMLNNPRSRVNNRTEANGKPKRICKMDMSEASIACRRGEDPPKRGRPRKISPKSSKEGGLIDFYGKRNLNKAAGKKKAKKSGKPKYDVI